MKCWATWACEETACRTKNELGCNSAIDALREMREHIANNPSHVASVIVTANLPDDYAPTNAILFTMGEEPWPSSE